MLLNHLWFECNFTHATAFSLFLLSDKLVFTFEIKSVEYAVSIRTFSRRTKHAAVDQKLHNWTYTPLRWWGSRQGSCNTLAKAAVSVVRKKKGTGHAKFGGQGGSYLLSKNAGFSTDLCEITRVIYSLVGCFPIPSANERRLSSTRLWRKKRKEHRGDNTHGVLENCQELGRIRNCQIKKNL